MRQTAHLPLPLVFGAVAAMLGSSPTAQSGLPAPMEPVAAILEAFRSHAVVALGDPHGEFFLHVVRDPRLPGVVNDIVIEAANARYQELVDRFVQGENIPTEALRPVWQDSTQVQLVLDPPFFTDIIPAIRSVNGLLPPERRLRVLLGDPPVDWATVKTPTDHWRWIEQRDTFPAELIRREVLARKRRALLVFGQMHFQRKNAAANFTSDGPAATIVSLLEDAGDTRVFTIWWTPALEKRYPEVAKWPVPSVATVRGTALGAEAVTYDGPRFAIRNGQPHFTNPIPRTDWRSLRAQEQYDALLYLGTPGTQLNPSRELCSDAAYLQRRRERLALVKAGPQILEDVRRACDP